MPEDMSSEHRNAPPGYAGPTSISEPPGYEEQLHSARNFPQPESVTHAPDIRLQLDPNNPDYDRELEYTLRNGRMTRPGFTSVYDLLKHLPAVESGQGPELLESLRKNMTKAVFHKIGAELTLLGEVVGPMEEVTFPVDRERGSNAYDFAELLAEHSVIEDEEEVKTAILRQINDEIKLHGAIINLIEAAGVAGGRYWDAFLMTNALLTASGRRRILLSDEFNTIFSTFSKGKNAELQKTKDAELLKPLGLEEGIRGSFVDRLSDQHYWKLATHSAILYNPLDMAHTMDGSTSMRLSPLQLNFVRRIFRMKDTKQIKVGGVEIPDKLLSYYTSVNTGDEKDKWYAIMQALLLVDAQNRIGEIELKPVGEQGSLVDGLVSDVEKRAAEILANKGDMPSNDEKLAFLAIQIGIGFDYATHQVAELGQYLEWKEKLDKKGEITGYYPAPEVGSPNTATDVTNAMAWVLHELRYSEKGRVRTKFLAPFDIGWEEFVRESGGGMGWIPNITDERLSGYLSKVPGLRKAAAILDLWGLGDKSDKEYALKVRGNRKFNPKFKGFLEKIMFGIPLNLTTPSGDKIVFPVPLRTGFTSINYLRTLLDAEAKQTVQEKLLTGKFKLKDIDFNKFSFTAFDEFHVNMSMLTRVLSLMFGMHNQKNADEYLPEEGRNREEIGLGALVKRYDIFGRQEHVYFEGEKVPRHFFEVVYSAYEYVAYIGFQKHDLWNLDPANAANQIKSYWASIDELLIAAEKLPKHKGKFKDYRDSMVLIIRFLAECVATITFGATGTNKNARDEVVKATDLQSDRLRMK